MPQFKAEPDKTYVNPVTGMQVSYTPEQLKDVATGFLSTQFQEKQPPVAPPTSGDIFTQQWNMLSSQPAQQRSTEIQTSLDEMKNLQAQQEDEAKKRREQVISNIQSEYGTREQQLREQQGEQRSTEEAIEYKTGRTGTPYAASETSKFEAQRQQTMDALLQQKQQAIQAAENAYADYDFQLSQQYLEKAQALEEQRYETERQSAQDFFDQYIKTTQLDISKRGMKLQETEAAQKQATALADQLAPMAAGQDWSAIQSLAKQYNIDPNILAVQSVKYSNEKITQDWLNSQKAVDIISKTTKGGMITLPTGEQMQIAGVSADNKPTTLKGKDFYYQYDINTGNWVKTGVPSDQLTDANILSTMLDLTKILEAAGTPDEAVTKAIYNSLGIPYTTPISTTPNITSPSGHDYDMSTYNAPGGQAYINDLQDKINSIGKLNTPQDINNYIKNNEPSSPLTAGMITNASSKYGVGWEELIALTDKECNLGTSNVCVNNNNPGGITWSQSYQDKHPDVAKGTARPTIEGGNYVKFKTLQDGLNATAEQLATRKTIQPIGISPEAPDPKTANIVDKNTGLTPNGVYHSALELAFTKNMPSFGFGNSNQVKNARTSIINKAAAIASNLGSDFPTLQAAYKSGNAALVKLTTQYTGIVAYEAQALKNADLVEQYSKLTPRRAEPLINRYLNWEQGRIEGTTPILQLETAIYAFCREYAKTTTGGALSAQALTDSAQKDADRLISASMNPEQLTGVIKVMKQEMENRKTTMMDTITQTSSGLTSTTYRVREKSTGRTGTISKNEYNSNLYEIIQ